MTPLKLIHSHADFSWKTRVQFQLDDSGENIIARFEVFSSPIYANSEFSRKKSQWGLWDWDVVELFLCNPSKPELGYFEFQLSPLGQHFELQIFEPRKKWNENFASGFQHQVKVSESQDWEARMEVPKNILELEKGQNVVGNAFAILGKAEQRAYWSLFLPKQEKPDFHLPDYFKRF